MSYLCVPFGLFLLLSTTFTPWPQISQMWPSTPTPGHIYLIGPHPGRTNFYIINKSMFFGLSNPITMALGGERDSPVVSALWN